MTQKLIEKTFKIVLNSKKDKKVKKRKDKEGSSLIEGSVNEANNVNVNVNNGNNENIANESTVSGLNTSTNISNSINNKAKGNQVENGKIDDETMNEGSINNNNSLNKNNNTNSNTKVNTNANKSITTPVTANEENIKKKQSNLNSKAAEESEEDPDDSKFISSSERERLSERVKRLANDGLASLVRLVQKECPSSIEDLDDEKLLIKIPCLDRKTYEQINQLIDTFLRVRETNQENLGNKRVKDKNF